MRTSGARPESRPDSTKRTETLGRRARREARTQPEVPPPHMMKSKAWLWRVLGFIGLLGCIMKVNGESDQLLGSGISMEDE